MRDISVQFAGVAVPHTGDATRCAGTVIMTDLLLYMLEYAAALGLIFRITVVA